MEDVLGSYIFFGSVVSDVYSIIRSGHVSMVVAMVMYLWVVPLCPTEFYSSSTGLSAFHMHFKLSFGILNRFRKFISSPSACFYK